MLPILRMTLFIQNYDCWRNTSFQQRVFLLIVYVDPRLDCLVLSIGSLSGTLFQFCKSITLLTANNQEYMYVKCPSILYSNRETKDRFAQCFPSNSYSIYCTNIRPELYPQEYVSSLLTIHHSKYDNIIVLIKKSPMLLKYISFVNPVFCYWRIWWDSLISLFLRSTSDEENFQSLFEKIQYARCSYRYDKEYGFAGNWKVCSCDLVSDV